MKKNGCQGLFNYYATLEDAVRALYPDFGWKRSKFVSARASPGFWEDEGNLKDALALAEQKLGITQVHSKSQQHSQHPQHPRQRSRRIGTLLL